MKKEQDTIFKRLEDKFSSSVKSIQLWQSRQLFWLGTCTHKITRRRYWEEYDQGSGHQLFAFCISEDSCSQVTKRSHLSRECFVVGSPNQERQRDGWKDGNPTPVLFPSLTAAVSLWIFPSFLSRLVFSKKWRALPLAVLAHTFYSFYSLF